MCVHVCVCMFACVCACVCVGEEYEPYSQNISDKSTENGGKGKNSIFYKIDHNFVFEYKFALIFSPNHLWQHRLRLEKVKFSKKNFQFSPLLNCKRHPIVHDVISRWNKMQGSKFEVEFTYTLFYPPPLSEVADETQKRIWRQNEFPISVFQVFDLAIMQL